MKAPNETYPLELPAEHMRAVRTLAKERGVTPRDVLRLAVWAFLTPLYGLEPPPGLPPKPAAKPPARRSAAR